VKVASALAKRDFHLSIPSEPVNDDVIVAGTKHKMLILQEYKGKFGGDTHKSIIMRKKGKHSHEMNTITPTRMSPSIRKYYRVKELTLYNVITLVIKEHRDSFTSTDILNLSRINRDFSSMIPKTIWWLQLDFSSLCNPQYNYKSQDEISSIQVEMASAAMIHFGLNPGKLVRWLGGKYTGRLRKVNCTLTAVKDHVGTNNFNHMKSWMVSPLSSLLTNL